MSILVLAPHADDEVLGVGGTVAKLAASGESVTVAVLTGHGVNPHPLWAEDDWVDVRRECQKACELLGVNRLLFSELPAACLDNEPAWKINRDVQALIESESPEQLFVPFANDLHKDHGAIAYAASVAARPYLSTGRGIKRILAYETLSETHLSPAYLEPAFQPNYFVDITSQLDVKLAAMAAYKSQLQDELSPRSLRSLRALAQLRGAHIGVEAAEAFFVLRELG